MALLCGTGCYKVHDIIKDIKTTTPPHEKKILSSFHYKSLNLRDETPSPYLHRFECDIFFLFENTGKKGVAISYLEVTFHSPDLNDPPLNFVSDQFAANPVILNAGERKEVLVHFHSRSTHEFVADRALQPPINRFNNTDKSKVVVDSLKLTLSDGTELLSDVFVHRF